MRRSVLDVARLGATAVAVVALAIAPAAWSLTSLTADWSLAGTAIAAGVEASRYDVLPVTGVHPYSTALQRWHSSGQRDVPQDTGEIHVAATDYSAISDAAAFVKAGFGSLDWGGSTGWVEYEVQVDTPGLYCLRIDYTPKDDGIADIERAIRVDGSFPFEEARRLILDRRWRNERYPFDRDDFNNEIRARQEQVFQRESKLLDDANGRHSEPFRWYFDAGRHTIRIEGLRSGVILHRISLVAPPVISPYVAPGDLDVSHASGWMVSIEAENPSSKSHSSVMAAAGGDPIVSPREDGVTLYNTLSWKKGGEWAEWSFEVPRDGYYQIGFRFRQNIKQGMPAHRTILIDGKVPFEEFMAYPFRYDYEWQSSWVTNSEGRPCLVWLSAGRHVIRLVADNSPMRPILDAIVNVITDLRDLSLTIKMATGGTVDRYRDWDLEQQIPDAESRLRSSARRLRDEYDRLLQLAGHTPDSAAPLLVCAAQLDDLADRMDLLPLRYRQLSLDGGSVAEVLGNAMIALQEEPLQIDQVYIADPEAQLPPARSSLLTRLWVTISNFIRSFGRDYDAVGKGDEDALTIWVGRGRDYVSLMQQLTDRDFTPRTGIRVAFSVMPREDQLILANSAGEPPDLATGVYFPTPVTLASRNALVDLTTFDDYEEVVSRFHPGALVSYQYLGGVYALPETQNFWVLFYRRDIIEALEIRLPDTWDDVVSILPLLQQRGMNFYIPVSAGTGVKSIVVTAPFILQEGAELYQDGGLRSGLSTPEALRGFRRMVELYTTYSIDQFVAVVFQNLRSGDIPIGVSDYLTYTQLKAAAPELEGLWGIAPMPGVVREDGQVARWAPGASHAAIMFRASERQEQAWEWLKWWTSAETQATYGNEVEALFGPGYRWNTANLEAIAQIPWTEEELRAIRDQWKWLKDIPQVPGGYMLERELSFAWNRAVIGTASGIQNPRQALEEADRNISRELLRKQLEFGLVDEQGNPLRRLELPLITEPWDVGQEDVR